MVGLLCSASTIISSLFSYQFIFCVSPLFPLCVPFCIDSKRLCSCAHSNTHRCWQAGCPGLVKDFPKAVSLVLKKCLVVLSNTTVIADWQNQVSNLWITITTQKSFLCHWVSLLWLIVMFKVQIKKWNYILKMKKTHILRVYLEMNRRNCSENFWADLVSQACEYNLL